MGTRMLMLVAAALVASLAVAQVQQPYMFTLYDGQTSNLAFTLQSWSFGRINLKTSQPVASGDQYSISLGCGYDTALALHGSLVFPFANMQSLQFSVNGGSTGNQDLMLSLFDPQAQVGRTVSLKNDLGIQIKAMQWVSVSVPFAKFQNGTKPQPGDLLYGLHITAPPTSQSQDTVYISSIRAVASPPAAQHVSVTVSKAAPNAPEVSPLIFGVNFGSVPQISKNKYKANRWGGNAVTRYAWDLDVNNHAADWFFEDIANNVDEKLLPFNTSSDAFVRDTVATGSVPVLTLPTIGWAPFDRNRRCGFSVAKYGPQQRADQFDSDCGNGVKQDGSYVTGNLPTDTSRAVGPAYVLDWLAHLETAFGAATVNSMLYILDNEPNYWDSTHRDVHPKPLTYDELWNYTVSYATAIKAKYPSVSLMGPDISGYCHLFFSPADGFCKDGSDRKAHSDLPLIQWFIQQLGSYAQKNNGVHLLDYLDIHCYPDAPMGKSGDMATTVLLLRSTRELWDPTYTAETWYMQPTFYLRQIRQYINQYAPWLKISCTEYNYGFDDSDVSGAVANVEVFGIYAREGVSLATRWVAPQNASKAEKAFKLALNYDGNGGHLSGKVLDTTSSDSANLVAYAFDDGHKLQVILICKQPSGSVPVALDLSATGVTSGTADIYRLDASHDGEKIGTATISSSGTTTVVATGVSATLLVLQH